MCELLCQGEGVAADGQNVSLDGLRFGLQHSESVSHRGVNLGQSLLVLTQCGELTDQCLCHLLHCLAIELKRDGETEDGDLQPCFY